MKIFHNATLLVLCTIAVTASAQTRVDVEAGPIWNQEDAQQKCPALAQRENGRWTGQWRTTVFGQMSVCEIEYQVQAPSANGWNANRVVFGRGGQLFGEFVQTSGRNWQERPATVGGSTFYFQEQNRDEWSVYLYDPSRQVNIQLDLYTRKIYYSDSSSPRRELYEIQGATGQVTHSKNSAQFDPRRFYRLTTDFRGTGMSLDIVNGGPRNDMAHLHPTGRYSGQFWQLRSAGNGFYRLTTEFRGEAMCLDVFNGGALNNMTHLVPCANYSGQFWKLNSTGDGKYRMTTSFRGENMCLDVFNGGDYNNFVHLTPCANYSGQFWSIRESR